MFVFSGMYAFIWPFRISTAENPPTLNLLISDFFATFVFSIDIFTNFITPITQKDAAPICDIWIIAKTYMKTWFIFDLIACFPFTYYRYISDPDAG